MEDFTYVQPPSRVIFGFGTLAKLPAELHRLHVKSPLILCSPRRSEHVKNVLSSIEVPIQPSGFFTEAKLHTPIEITNKAMEYVHDVKPDCIVSVGGGSTIGLGKAISVRSGLPHITVPTTYSGSEMTASLGETEGGKKLTRTDEKIRPGTVIYDVELTMSLPISMTATSGVNAIAHAVESLWAPNRNPVVRLMATEGIKSLFTALPGLKTKPDDVEMRRKALYGAYLCASCSGNGVRMGIHHKLAHTLGGSFNMPHSETHTALLPVTFAYNKQYILPEDIEKLKGLGIEDLLDELGVEKRLEKLGLKKEDIPKAASIAMEGITKMQGNGVFMMGKGSSEPKQYTEEDCKRILEDAWVSGTEQKAFF